MTNRMMPEVLFKRMDKRTAQASKVWNRLRNVQTDWESCQTYLKERGLWEEYCKTRQVSADHVFFDLGA